MNQSQSPQRRRGRGRGKGRGHPVNVSNISDITNRTIGDRSNNNPRSTAAQGATKKKKQNHVYTTTTTSNLPSIPESSSESKSKENKKRTKKTKRFRKMKVLRMWVLPTLFLIPLFIILFEYYIGKIISLDDIQDVYVEQIYNPWELLLRDINEMNDSIDTMDNSISSDTTTTTTTDIMEYYPNNNNNNKHTVNIVGSLPNISYTVRSKCPHGLRRMINVHNPMSHSNYGQHKRYIPMIVHQQSKTRCLTMNVDRYVLQDYMIYEITAITTLQH